MGRERDTTIWICMGHPAPSPMGHQGDIANGTYQGYRQWDTKGAKERLDWNVFGI